MILTFGYLKDLLAFIGSIICIILFFIYKIKPPKFLLYAFISLVFIFDGLFTFFPFLHNYNIYNLL